MIADPAYLVTTYAIDSYKPVAGSLLVSVTINKNVWGYGFSVFITPWIIKVCPHPQLNRHLRAHEPASRE
jgi:hypothetical protein